MLIRNERRCRAVKETIRARRTHATQVTGCPCARCAYSWPPSAEAVEWATAVAWNAREIHRNSSIHEVTVAVASRFHKHDEAVESQHAASTTHTSLVSTAPWIKGALQDVHFCDYCIYLGLTWKRCPRRSTICP